MIRRLLGLVLWQSPTDLPYKQRVKNECLTRHSLATRHPGRRALPTRFCTRLNLAADRSGYVNGRRGSGKDALDVCLAAGGGFFEHISPPRLFFQAGRLRGGQSVNAGIVASWVPVAAPTQGTRGPHHVGDRDPPSRLSPSKITKSH